MQSICIRKLVAKWDLSSHPSERLILTGKRDSIRGVCWNAFWGPLSDEKFKIFFHAFPSWRKGAWQRSLKRRVAGASEGARSLRLSGFREELTAPPCLLELWLQYAVRSQQSVLFIWLCAKSGSLIPQEVAISPGGAKPMSHRACFLLKRSQRAQRNHISCCQYWAGARNPKATTVAEQLPSTINLRFTVTQSFLKSLISEATVLLFSKCCIFRWNPLEGARVKIEVWFWWMKELRCVWVLGK